MFLDVHTSASLRRELSARNLVRGAKVEHEATYGSVPSVIYAEDGAGGHGNFLAASYRRILADPAWRERLGKAYTASARVPRSADRTRRELDCAASSDALLMNVFCYPGALRRKAVCDLLGVEAGQRPEFGVRVRLAMRRDEIDRTEVDMRLNADAQPLLFEAKLTETGFQTASRERLLRYERVEEVFALEDLPQSDRGFVGYQLIRGVLAAEATGSRFVLLADRRRTDLHELWMRVLRAVQSYDLRSRMALLTWQDLAAAMPLMVQTFLQEKYGICGALQTKPR